MQRAAHSEISPATVGVLGGYGRLLAYIMDFLLILRTEVSKRPRAIRARKTSHTAVATPWLVQQLK